MRGSWSMAGSSLWISWRSTSSSGRLTWRWWRCSDAELLLKRQASVLDAPGTQMAQERHAEQRHRHIGLIDRGGQFHHLDRADLQAIDLHRRAAHLAIRRQR